MPKIVIIQGTPCAGKSTWARSEVSGKEDWIIVSLDDIRHSMGEYWNLKREPLVVSTEEFMIRQALRMNFNVVVDSVNLAPERVSHLKKLADENDAVVEFKQMYVPFREAVRRDGNDDRPHHIGADKIREFYRKYYPAEYEAEMATPVPDTPAAPVDDSRIIIDTDGNIIWRPTPSDLEKVKKLSILSYSISAIAMALGVPVSEFRRYMADSGNSLYQAYHAGRIEGEMAYRQKVVNLANSGEEWAIRMLESWKRAQHKEELGFEL